MIKVEKYDARSGNLMSVFLVHEAYHLINRQSLVKRRKKWRL